MTNTRIPQLSVLILIIFSVFSMTSCRKDNDKECCDPTNPDCPNYNPCYGVEEPTAEITMRELYIFDGVSFTPSDSVFVNEVEFSSPHTSDEVEHTWYLGAETINESSFSRTHNGVSRPAFITVSHVIEYPVDSECFPNSLGRDSTSSTYYLIEYVNELLIYSEFRGAFENETDSFDFEISVLYPDFSPVEYPANQSNNPETYAFNFHNIGDTTTSEDLSFLMGGRNLIGHLTGTGYMSPKGTIRVDSTNRSSVQFEYEYLNQDYVVNARILN